jgi:hypothetical protein
VAKLFSAFFDRRRNEARRSFLDELGGLDDPQVYEATVFEGSKI